MSSYYNEIHYQMIDEIDDLMADAETAAELNGRVWELMGMTAEAFYTQRKSVDPYGGISHLRMYGFDIQDVL